MSRPPTPPPLSVTGATPVPPPPNASNSLFDNDDPARFQQSNTLPPLDNININSSISNNKLLMVIPKSPANTDTISNSSFRMINTSFATTANLNSTSGGLNNNKVGTPTAANNNNNSFGKVSNTSFGMKSQKKHERGLSNVSFGSRKSDRGGGHHRTSSNPSHHHRRTSSQIDVVYAVDADIRRPDPNSPLSSPERGRKPSFDSKAATTTIAAVNNAPPTAAAANSTTTAVATTTAATATTQPEEKPKRKIKTRTIETQTKLSYHGTYAYGRPFLNHTKEDPEVYIGNTMCCFLMIGMIFDLFISSISYFLSWRLREPSLLALGNQEFWQKMFPTFIGLGAGVIFGICLPLLSYVSSGYVEAKRSDRYFLAAQIIYTLCYGAPCIIIETSFIGTTLTKQEVVKYQPYQVQLSQFAMAFHCLTSGFSLWSYYLTFASRKLNDAVESRRQMWVEYHLGLIGKRKCAASKMAIRTIEEVEMSQQEDALYALGGGGSGGGKRMSFVPNNNDHRQKSEIITTDSTSSSNAGAPKTHQRFHSLLGPQSPAEAGGFKNHQRTSSKGEFKIGNKVFQAISNSKTAAEAADDTGEENVWGSPFKEDISSPVNNDPASTLVVMSPVAATANVVDASPERRNSTTVDVPPSAQKKENDEKDTKENKKQQNKRRSNSLVNFAPSPELPSARQKKNNKKGNDDDNDDEEHFKKVAARNVNVVDEDDPFRKH